MSDFKNNLEDFYKVLTPLDLYGRTRQIATNSSVSLEREVYENYLVGVYGGDQIISNLKGKNIEGLGIYFNTVFQGKTSATADYLEPQYWHAMSEENIVNASTPASPAANFYSDICQQKSTDGPPVNFSINVLRSTYAAPGTSKGTNAGKAILPYGIRNCDAVEFFLNYMPSIFPSMMVPYFEVEFDFPVKLPSQDPKDGRELDAYFLNRPSLIRFLIGSSQIGDYKTQTINLTEADKSLIFAKQVKTRSGKIEPAYSVGMELFTTPQTLTNMDTLRTSINRVVDVKPFLPPATLTGGSINVLNAGAEVMATKKASIQFVVHDKARVSEFSEFFRVAQGTQDLTVWLTFGWLSPRGDTENDAYSRFINQTMLTKFAFNISNASFSFDSYGQANISVELVSQGALFVDTYNVDYVDNETELFQSISTIKENIKLLEDAQVAVGNVTKEQSSIKFVQDVKSTFSSAGPKSLSSEEISKINVLINQVSTSKSIGGDLRTDLIKGLGAILALNGYYNKNGGALRVASRSYAAKKFEECRSVKTLDPFLPEAFKKTIKVQGKDYVVFKDDLIGEIEKLNKQYKVIETKTTGAKKTITVGNKKFVSFGKVFSCFCLTPLLYNAKSQGIEEVQVNFYQLNASCGPLSLHSVAEFPIDMDMLQEMFAIESEKLGSDAMTISRFMRFVVNSYMGDDRAVGYGLTTFYEDYTREKPEMKSKQKIETLSFDESKKRWVDQYGTLINPHINVMIEVVKKRTTTSNIDLLTEVRNPDVVNLPRIMKIHIFDSKANPYDNIKKRILKNSAGAYLGIPQEKITPELTKMDYDKVNKTVTIGDVTVVASESQNPLIDYIGNAVPTIQVGSNGSLVSSIGFSSKLDPKLATALMVPTQKNFRNTNTLSPNGLAMTNNLPVRITDSSVSMTSLGCPIADLYQHFYIDFGTGTTLDNIYTATSLSHTFAQGKFETSWTFIPVDGYAAFAGAQSTADAVKAAEQALADKQLEEKKSQ